VVLLVSGCWGRAATRMAWRGSGRRRRECRFQQQRGAALAGRPALSPRHGCRHVLTGIVLETKGVVMAAQQWTRGLGFAGAMRDDAVAGHMGIVAVCCCEWLKRVVVWRCYNEGGRPRRCLESAVASVSGWLLVDIAINDCALGSAMGCSMSCLLTRCLTCVVWCVCPGA
jgi:hypothetical protein